MEVTESQVEALNTKALEICQNCQKQGLRLQEVCIMEKIGRVCFQARVQAEKELQDAGLYPKPSEEAMAKMARLLKNMAESSDEKWDKIMSKKK